MGEREVRSLVKRKGMRKGKVWQKTSVGGKVVLYDFLIIMHG